MKIEHGYRDWKHHLRLKGTPRVESAAQLAGLMLGVVALYWYLCLLAARSTHRHPHGELASWGDLGLFKAGMELACLGDHVLGPASSRLIAWVAGKLSHLRPLPSKHNWRYLRRRVALP